MPPEDHPTDDRRLARARRAARRAGTTLARLDRNPRLVVAAKTAREALPGDAQFGDPLSTAGEENPHVAGRRLAALTRKRPGVLREVGSARCRCGSRSPRRRAAAAAIAR